METFHIILIMLGIIASVALVPYILGLLLLGTHNDFQYTWKRGIHVLLTLIGVSAAIFLLFILSKAIYTAF